MKIDAKTKNELIKLLNNSSKHSNYQILPKFLNKYIDINQKNINSRFENERFEYLNKNLSLNNKTILDIGGNTGYFTFKCFEKISKKLFI